MGNKIFGNSHQEVAINGDTTSGRVMRISQLLIEDGTDVSTIKCTLSSKWNGDAIAATDNIGKSSTVGNFTLNINGGTLTVEAAGLAGNAVAIVAAYPEHDSMGYAYPLIIESSVVSNDIQLSFTGEGTAPVTDLTGQISGTEKVRVHLAYITDV